MIELYKASNTNYENHGDIVLSPFSCVIQAEINGTWGLALTHPIDKEGKFKELVTGAVIKAPSFNGSQLFRIRETIKADDGIICEADPIFLDARGDAFIQSVHPTDATGQQALTALCNVNNKYTGSSDILRDNTAYFETRNLIDAIAGESPSFLERWGGEILYNNFEIIINERIGGDYGVKVLYGKNLVGVRETVNVDNVVTRIYPYAHNGHTLENNGYIDSPISNSYPTIHAQKRVYDNIKLAQDVTGEEPQENDIICADLTELRQALTDAVNSDYAEGADKPVLSLEIDMVLLQNTTAYKDFVELETVSLGDTVHCKHAILGIESDARVVSLVYDSIRKGVTSVVLNSERDSLFNQLSSVVQAVGKAITPNGNVKAEQIQGFIDGALAQLRLQNTIAKRQDVRAILFEDLDPQSTTFGALSIGTQGLQISKTRTSDGRDWVWTTAATSEGILAGTIIAQEQLAVAKHFFADATGVHVTEDEYDATTGNNILINGTSVDVRQGTTSVASFGATTRIGQRYGQRVQISDWNTVFYDSNNNPVGYISTSGETQYADYTIVTLHDISRDPDGLVRVYYPIDLIGDVLVSDSPLHLVGVTCERVQPNGDTEPDIVDITQKNTAYFFTSIGGGDEVGMYFSDEDGLELFLTPTGYDHCDYKLIITYEYLDSGPAYSFGKDNVARLTSMAQGRDISAQGAFSQGFGQGTITDSSAQVAIGRFNEEVENGAFIIGNGASDEYRNNIFVVDKSGNVSIKGSITDAKNLVTRLTPSRTTYAAVGQTPSNPLVIRAYGTLGQRGLICDETNKVFTFYDYDNNQPVFRAWNNEIKRKTITVTTNSYGNANLNLNGSDYTVLAVAPQNPYWAIPFIYTAAGGALQWWARILSNTAAWNSRASESIQLVVYYQENHFES